MCVEVMGVCALRRIGSVCAEVNGLRACLGRERVHACMLRRGVRACLLR